MSYAKNNLLKDEMIIKTAQIHWFIYISALFVLMLSFSFREMEAAWIILLVVGIVVGIKAFIIRKSTEFFITNKRIIAKSGLIARDTIEINLNKIEGLGVKQGILGRMFNYGTVIINGTGSTSAPFRFIADPLSLRHALNEQIENKV